MISALKRWWWRQQFFPGYLGFLANPFWLTRTGLLGAVRRHAPALGTGRILDFGCGAKPYRELFPSSAEYIGVDIEISGHDHRNEQIEVFYDGRSLPLPDAHVDAVFSSEVFEHVFEPERIMGELHRVLRPGGCMLLTVPFSWEEHEEPWDYARYTSFGLKALLERHGFRVVYLEKTGNDFQVIGQLASATIYSRLPGRMLFQAPLILLLCAPCLVTGAFLGWLLGNHQRLYLNTIVLAERLGPV